MTCVAYPLSHRLPEGAPARTFFWVVLGLSLVCAPRATPDKPHILESQPLGYSFAQGSNAMWGARLKPALTGGHLDLAPDVEASTGARHLVMMTAEQAGSAYDTETIITFVFREHTITGAPMPKP